MNYLLLGGSTTCRRESLEPGKWSDQYDVCENYVDGYGGLSESGLYVFCKLCQVCFLVVGKCKWSDDSVC